MEKSVPGWKYWGGAYKIMKIVMSEMKQKQACWYGLLDLPSKEDTDPGKWVNMGVYGGTLWPARQRGFYSYLMNRLTAVREYQISEAKAQTVKHTHTK